MKIRPPCMIKEKVDRKSGGDTFDDALLPVEGLDFLGKQWSYHSTQWDHECMPEIES